MPAGVVPAERGQATARAVQRLAPIPGGLRLEHLRRTVDFTPDGLVVRGRRGAPDWRWSFLGARTTTGESIVAAHPVPPVDDRGQRVEFARGAIVEEYLLGLRSIEQRFQIPEPLPLGGGDLVVAGEIRSDGEFAERENGWIWSNARAEVTLGRATVFDAAGEVLPCRFEVAADRTRLVVDGAALARATYPVTIDPEVGANDYRISDMGPNGDPAFDAFEVAVAYNSHDNTYVVVWAGDNDTGGLVDEEYEIFGQRIDPTGGGLGANDARLSDMGGTGDPDYGAFDPAVAYNAWSNEYLVVWLGDDNVGGLVEGEFEVFSQRLDAALGGLGSNDFRLSDAGGVGNPSYDVSWGPNVAFNSSSGFYMVTWAGEDTVGGMVDGEVEVFTQMLTAAIAGVGPNDERISDLGGLGSLNCAAETPVVAANTWTGEFLVAWSGDDTEAPLVAGEREAFVQRMDGPEIFVDIFESGTTYLWTLVAP